MSRATWSPRRGAQVLLGLLVEAFAGKRPLIFGIDDTIERWRGAKIKAKGIYREPVRSSKSHLKATS